MATDSIRFSKCAGLSFYEIAFDQYKGIKKNASTILQTIDQISSSQDFVRDIFDQYSDVSYSVVQAVKTIKRSLKGMAPTELQLLKDEQRLLNKIAAIYSKITMRVNHRFEHEEIDRESLALQVYKAQKLIKTVKETLHIKEQIFQGNELFKDDIRIIPRFDLWMKNQMKLNPERTLNIDRLKSIIEKLYLKNGIVDMRDLCFIDTYITNMHSPTYNIFNLSNEEKAELDYFVITLKEEINAVVKKKIALLKELNEELKRVNSDVWNAQKIKYKIWYRQILHNPLEPAIHIDIFAKICICERLYEVVLMNTAIPCNTQIQNYKLEGLKRLRQEQMDDDNILISGTGPGGLMLGLIACLQGKKFTIIESREQAYALTRDNIVVLGKDSDPRHVKLLRGRHESLGIFWGADLKLLDFFGITDDLVSSKKAQEMNGYFSVAINDLQKAMIDKLSSLCEKQAEEFIQYDTKIKAIFQPQEDCEFAGVQLHTSKQPDLVVTPSLVYVMEGSKSTTRRKLGIDVIKETKQAPMGFSFFLRYPQRLSARVAKTVGMIRDVATATGSLSRVAWKADNQSDLYQQSYKLFHRGELLLRTPASDYLYFTLSEKEQKKVERFRLQLEIAIDRSRNSTDVSAQVEKWENAINRVAKEISITACRRWNLILLYDNQKWRKRRYNCSQIITSQIQRAEVNNRQLGNTHFYLGGDSETTTDPASGSGLRTTLLRALIMADTMRNPKLRANSFAKSALEYSTSLSARGMREEGLFFRQMYRANSERLERFIGIAENSGVLSTIDRNFLLGIEAKLKVIKDHSATTHLHLSAEDKLTLEFLYQKLLQEYKKSEVIAFMFKYERKPETINESHWLLFKKAWISFRRREKVQISSEDLRIINHVAARMALEISTDHPDYSPESWFVPLSAFINNALLHNIL